MQQYSYIPLTGKMSLTLRKLRDVKISNQILKNLITINKGGRNYVISN